MTDKDTDLRPAESKADDLRVICPSCGTNLAAYETLCPKCMAPIGAFSNLDPVHAARSEGAVFSKAAASRPKPIVLIGVWVMFLPAFLAGLAVAISVALQDAGSGSSGFVFFWIGMAIAVFSFVMLYKVTRNYLEPAGPTKE